MTLLLVRIQAQNRWASFFERLQRNTFSSSCRRLREGTLGDQKNEMLARPRWSRRALWTFHFATETKSGCLTPVWDFLKRLLVPPHPQKKNVPLFLLKSLVRKTYRPQAVFELGLHQCSLALKSIMHSNPSNLQPNTCLWVMSRLGVCPKPAFRLSLCVSLSLILPPSLSLSGWRISTKCLFSVSVQRVIQDHQSAVRRTGGFTVKGFRYSEVPKEVSP